MSDCNGGFAVPEFDTTVGEPLKTEYGEVEANAAPTKCSTKLTGAKKTECADFTKWSQWTGSACYFLKTAAFVVEAEVKDQKVMKEIYYSLGIVYNVIKGANEAFNQSIVDVNNNTPFTPVISPSNPPDFPPVGKGDDMASIIQNAWNAMEPFLEQAITKIQDKDPSSKWVIILQGIIDKSNDTITQIVKLLNTIKGK